MDKNGQIIDVFDPLAFKIFIKSIHNKSLSVRDKCLSVSKDKYALDRRFECRFLRCRQNYSLTD